MFGLSFTTEPVLAQELAQVLRNQAGSAGLGADQIQVVAPQQGNTAAVRGMLLESVSPEMIEVIVSGLASGTLPAVAQIIAAVLRRRREDWQVTVSNRHGGTRTLSAQNTSADTFQQVLRAIMDLSGERPHRTLRQRGRPAAGTS